jgi:hypothetical protein
MVQTDMNTINGKSFATGKLAILALVFSFPGQAANVEIRPGNIANQQVVTVTKKTDSGPGSLRAALEQANQSGQPHKIIFGTSEGPFRTPQVIELSSPLPIIEGVVEISGHIPGLLWKAYGVSVNGNERFRVFEVAPQGELRISGITIENGQADTGAGILNHGRLVVEGVTLLANTAEVAGGAIANQGGEAYLINSTVVSNHATRGGGVANLAGTLRITNATLDQNHAEIGSAIYSEAQLTLGNSILTGQDTQCVNSGPLDEASTHNIFASSDGCGEPLLSADPHLGKINFYNGPTPTLPISSLSPAINLGDNAIAVDDAGNPLKWDQRGNGDPRFARGYVDIGAFEHQSQLPTELVVDTIEDTLLRGCTVTGVANCPIRAAVELSIAGRHPVPIRFLPNIFSQPQVLFVDELPENAQQPLVFDGEGTGGITIIVPQAVPWLGNNGVWFELSDSVDNPAVTRMNSQ